jgi:hypothetical protein
VGTFSSTAIEIIKWVKEFAEAKVCWDFEVGLLSRVWLWSKKQSKAKVSHILRPGNTAFKEQLKLVNGFER